MCSCSSAFILRQQVSGNFGRTLINFPVWQPDKACADKKEDTIDIFSSTVFRMEMCQSLLKPSNKTSAFIFIDL